MKRESTTYYPLFLRLNGKKCTVVGGGEVALRKVKALLDCDARVEVISPELCAELAQLAASHGLGVCRREYQRGDLKGSAVVIAATDNSKTNRDVVREARRENALVNSVDDAENSDFIVPSHLRRGDITIAISTAGSSPALARKIRTRLEQDFGDEYASLASLVGEVRAELNQRGIEVEPEKWQKALDLDLLAKLLKSGEQAKARAILIDNLTQRT